MKIHQLFAALSKCGLEPIFYEIRNVVRPRLQQLNSNKDRTQVKRTNINHMNIIKLSILKKYVSKLLLVYKKSVILVNVQVLSSKIY